MNILIVNDDGINAKGIQAIAKTLCSKHKVTVIAPDKECSGQGHRMSFYIPVIHEKTDIIKDCDCFILHNGSPCDCVKFGTGLIMKDKPDVIISGINNGANIATDIIYSGTVNAAIEGAMCGYKSIAVSLECKDNDYDYVCNFIDKNLEKLINMLPDNETVLNVNIPDSKKENIKGIKVCKAGKRDFHDEYQLVPNRGYLLTGYPVKITENRDEDAVWANKGYITITPIKPDFNDYELLETLSEVNLCELL